MSIEGKGLIFVVIHWYPRHTLFSVLLSQYKTGAEVVDQQKVSFELFFKKQR